MWHEKWGNVTIKPGEDNSYPDYDNSFFAHKGTEFVRYYDEFCYNISDNLVYTTNNAAQLGYALINYDFDIMDSLNCNYISSNSPDIKWIESTNELFELYGNSIKEYNPLSLELVNMISLSNFFEYPFNTSKRFIGATMIAVGGSYDDGHCYFLIDRSNNSYYQCEMLNMQDMTSNGSFIADSEWIYEVQDFQLFQRFNIEDKIKVFFKDNDYAVLIDEQNVEIVNLEEITIVNSFTIIQDTNYYNAYGSDLISCYDHYNDLYYEINIFNGAIDYNISASTFCYKTGNKIFSSSGLYMELEE